MSAQYLSDWNPSVIVATNQAILDKIDGAAMAGKVTIHKADDSTLLTVTLTDPCGSVNGSTGIATITPSGSATATGAGTASYATIRDGSNTALRSYPCQEGTSESSGYCVLSTLNITVGSSITMASMSLT